MTRYVQKLVTIVRIIFVDTKDVFPSEDSIIYHIGMISDLSYTLYHERFVQNAEDDAASSGARALLPYQC